MGAAEAGGRYRQPASEEGRLPSRHARYGAVRFLALAIAVLGCLWLGASRALADVSPSGGYQTSVAIEVPVYHGLEPRLGLAYDSNFGNGWVGVGWSLSGSSWIQRRSASNGAASYTSSDKFFLDGMELIPCQPTTRSPSCEHPAGSGYTAYTGKIETFQRIARSKNAADDNWYVWTKNGVKLTFAPHLIAVSDDCSPQSSPVGGRSRGSAGGAPTTYVVQPPHRGWNDTLWHAAEARLGDGRRWKEIYGLNKGLLQPDGDRLRVADLIRPGWRLRLPADATEPKPAAPSAGLSGTAGQVGGTDAAACQGGSGRRLVAADSVRKPTDGKVYDWHLTRVEDTLGNQVTYTYWYDTTAPNGIEGYLESISYGGTLVRFHSEQRTDVVSAATGTQSFKSMRYRLRTIEVSVGGQPSRAYSLRYALRTTGSARSLLEAVQKHGRDAKVDPKDGTVTGGTVLPATKLAYPESPSVGKFERQSDAPVSWGSGVSPNPYDDSSQFATDGVFAVRDGNRWFPGDLNGDGRQDWMLVTTRQNQFPRIDTLIARADGSYSSHSELPGWLLRLDPNEGSFGSYWYAGDVDGDGRSDIIGVSGNPFDEFGTIFAALSNGDGTFRYIKQPTPWHFRHPIVYSVNIGFSISLGFGGIGVTYAAMLYNSVDLKLPDRWFVGDVNGDGRTDVMAVQHGVNQGTLVTAMQTALSTGDEFKITPADRGPEWSWLWPNADVKRSRFFVADVDGDARSDFVMVAPYKKNGLEYATVAVGRSQGNGNFVDTYYDTQRRWQDEDVWFPGDTNGDGRTDLMQVIRHWDDAATPYAHAALRTWISDGEGNFPPTPLKETDLLWYLPIPCIGGWTPTVWFPGDTDGDGRTEFMQIYVNHDYNCTAGKDVEVSLAVARPRLDGTYEIVRRKSDQRWDWWDGDLESGITPGDVNGDHRTDVLLAFGKRATGWKVRTLLAPTNHRDTANWQPEDVSGDGRSDLFYVEYLNPGIRTHTVVRDAQGLLPKNAAGKVSPVTQDMLPDFDNADTSHWLPADVNGDGKSDHVYIDYASGQLQVYSLLSNGNGTWRPVPATVDMTAEDILQWRLGDTNGDGRTDLVHMAFTDLGNDHWELRIVTLLSNGDGNWTRAPPQTISDTQAWADWKEPTPPPPWKPTDTRNWKLLDVDGDGKVDLVHLAHGSLWESNSLFLTVNVLASRGDGAWSPPVSRAVPLEGRAADIPGWRPLDANADGKVDLVHLGALSPGVRVQTLLSTGAGDWAVHSTPLRADQQWRTWPDMQNWLPADLNADGRVDLVHAAVWGQGARVDTFMSAGDGSWKDQLLDTHSWPEFQVPDGIAWRLADVDGDGRTDLTRLDEQDDGVRPSTMRSVAPLDLLWTVRSDLGQGTLIGYAPSSRWLSLNPAAGCRLPLGVTAQTVSSIRTDDGRASQTAVFDTQSHSYECPKWSEEERSFLGWEHSTVSRGAIPNRPASTIQLHRRTYPPGIVQLDEVTLRDKTDRVLRSSRTVYQPIGQAPPYRSLAVGFNDYECNPKDVCLLHHVDVTPDEFGNSVQEIEYGGNGSEVLRTTRRAFHLTDGSKYITGLPWYETVHQGMDFSQPAAAATFFCYDGDNETCRAPPTTGLITAAKRWNEQQVQYHTTIYNYDKFGNRTKIIDPNQHSTTTLYDPVFHLYPEKTCDAANHCVTDQWDAVIGQLRSTTDTNKKATTFDYDPLGRLKDVIYPNGGRHHRSYPDWGVPGSQRVHEWDEDGSSDGLWTNQYIDGSGRVWRVVLEGDQPETTVMQDITYSDSSSLPYRQSHWYKPDKTSPVYEVFSYDSARRLIRQTHPDQTALNWRYSNDTTRRWTTEVDEKGREKTTFSDANGRLRRIQERSSNQDLNTDYGYDVLDNLTDVTDSAGNHTAIAWDSLSRKLSMTDPDLGKWTYTYDDAGNQLSQTDARGIVTRFTYDAVDRLKTRQPRWPSGPTTVWRYDEPGHGAGIGRLTSIQDPSGKGCPGNLSEHLTYDEMGQTEALRKCVQGRTYRLGFGFDKLGRQSSVTYPDGELVRYFYNSAGQLDHIPRYLNASTYEPNGAPHDLELANGIHETYFHDPNREWLTGTTVAKGSSTGSTYLFQAGYDIDPDGLLHVSSSVTHKMNLSYTYDDLRRLRSVSGDIDQSFTYDAIGNMRSNSRIGTYTYPVSGPDGCGTGVACPRPHAVQTAGSQTYSYDDNGNMTGRPGQQLTWNDDNQLRQVTMTGGRAARYQYDANGDRVMRERLQKGKVAGVTRYITPYVDVSGTGGLIKYYFAGDRLLARKDRTGTVWLHTDRLGSTRLLTDKSGHAVQRNDYRPFGEETGNVSPAASGNEIQFAGQRTDDLTGLNYMKSRFYDSQLGRFVSPDSLVPQPYNPQALNRYSYVYNNPTAYIDPSGHRPVDVEQPVLYVVDPPRQQQPPNAVSANCQACSFGLPELKLQPLDLSFNPPETPQATSKHAMFEEFAGSPLGAMGIRTTNLERPRQAYTNPVALDYATRHLREGGPSYIKFAELIEAGHGCAACHLTHNTGRPPTDVEFNIDHFNQVALWTAIASHTLQAVLAVGTRVATTPVSPATRLPAYAGGKAQGILVTPTGEVDLISGYKGPAASIPKGTRGFNNLVRSHVEAHAAAVMRIQKLREATLYINRVPCGGAIGCNAMLSRMLPAGARLRVVGPGGFDRWYVGQSP